jgi:hypothetical protein
MGLRDALEETTIRDEPKEEHERFIICALKALRLASNIRPTKAGAKRIACLRPPEIRRAGPSHPERCAEQR